MFPEDAESLECSFWLTSLLFPFPLHNLSSGSQCDKSSMYSEPPQGKPRLSQAGSWTEAALPGCQLVGQPEEAALFPGMEMRDRHCIGTKSCGKSTSKKPRGGGPAAGFAREMYKCRGYKCISVIGSTEGEGRTDIQGGGRARGLHMPISVWGSSRSFVCP